MNILQQIVADIQKDLILKKQIVSIRALETGPFFERQTIQMELSQSTNVGRHLNQTSILVFGWPMSHRAMSRLVWQGCLC